MTGKSKTADRPAVHSMASTALMAAVLCLLGPVSLPIGPVPISLGTLGIYLALYLLGWKRGTVSVLIYLLLGLVGLPVFSGFAGGLARLIGPTGGYLMGYLPMAWIAGALMDRLPGRVGVLVALGTGTAVLYICGTAYYCLLTGAEVKTAIGLCVLPFLPVDGGKLALAALVCPAVRARLGKGAG